MKLGNVEFKPGKLMGVAIHAATHIGEVISGARFEIPAYEGRERILRLHNEQLGSIEMTLGYKDHFWQVDSLTYLRDGTTLVKYEQK